MGKTKRTIKMLRNRGTAAPAPKAPRKRVSKKAVAAAVAAKQQELEQLVVDENPLYTKSTCIVWLDANMHSAIEYDRGHTVIRYVTLDGRITAESDTISWFERKFTPVPDYWPSKAALIYMESYLRKSLKAHRILQEILMAASKEVDVKKAGMKELLGYYNAHAPKPVEKFASETAARKACEILQKRLTAAATTAAPTNEDKENADMSTAATDTTKGKKSKGKSAPPKTKEKKAKAKSNGKDKSAGRSAKFDGDKKITVVSKEHGYRDGSNREQLFKLMKSGMTVSKYLEAGGASRALERALDAKLIKLS